MSRERSRYRDLVDRTGVPESPRPSNDGEPGNLVAVAGNRRLDATPARSSKANRVQRARQLFADELAPLFDELRNKYAKAGVTLEMDTEKFLKGGRELRIRFEMDGHCAELDGVVTDEAIAFQETRHAPHLGGELVSGPMLRLRRLTAPVFREFICERLTVLVRTALRKH